MSTSASNNPARIQCPACGGRVKVPAGPVDGRFRCPRCDADISSTDGIETSLPGSSGASESEDGGEYRLSDVVERRPLADVHEHLLVAAERELETERKTSVSEGTPQPFQTSKPAGGDVLAASARDLMGKAEAEAEELEQDTSRHAARPLFSNLFSFLFDVQAIARWIALTFLSLGCVVFLHLFISLQEGGAVHQFGAVFVGMLMAPLSLIYITLTSVCWLVIVQDTANGMDKVEQWPNLNFLDWMFDAFYILNSLFVSALPGIVIGQAVVIIGLGGQWVALLLGALTAIPLFPVILLSTLEAGSPLGLWSSALVRNLIRSRTTTRQFFLGSAALAVAAAVSLIVMDQQIFFISLLGAAGFNAAAMLYFRLLGRLAGLVMPEDGAGDAEQG